MVDYQKNIAAEMEQVAQAIAKLPPGDLSELNDYRIVRRRRDIAECL